MKIASWNIGEDESKDKNRLDYDSYDYIVNMIKVYNIDIICMQEAITTSELLIPIMEYIKNNTNLKYHASYEYSDSHINIGSKMGVVTCSKFPITKEKVLKFDNPNLVYKKDENTTYVLHDKGFIVTDTSGLTLINGHGFPFFAFKREALEFKDIYKKMETQILEVTDKKFIVLGDMNYPSFKDIYPKIYNITTNNINEYSSVRSDGTKQQLDYIMTSKDIKVNSGLVIDNRFDHRMCLIEIED